MKIMSTHEPTYAERVNNKLDHDALVHGSMQVLGAVASFLTIAGSLAVVATLGLI